MPASHSIPSLPLPPSLHRPSSPQAKPENLVDTFILLMPEAAKSGADLARICELQGYTKKLQSELLAQFQRKRGGGDPFGGAAPIPSPGGLPGAASAPAFPGGGSGVSSISSSSYDPGRDGLPGAASTGGIMGAGNLDALKLSVNTFTRELASSMKMVGPRGGGTSQDNSPMAGRDGKVGGGGGAGGAGGERGGRGGGGGGGKVGGGGGGLGGGKTCCPPQPGRDASGCVGGVSSAGDERRIHTQQPHALCAPANLAPCGQDGGMCCLRSGAGWGTPHNVVHMLCGCTH